MKKHLIWMLALAAATAHAPRAWSEPTAVALASATAEGRAVTSFKLKHADARALASWLAPLFQPDVVEVSSEIIGAARAEGDTPEERSHRLWVRASLENRIWLQQTVDLLDVPQRRVGIHLLAARVANSDLPRLLEVQVPAGYGAITMAAAPVWIRKRVNLLSAMLASGQASTLLNQRVTAANLGPARFETSTPAGSPAGSKDAFQASVTPAASKDGTLTLNLEIHRQAGATAQTTATSANFSDGDAALILLQDADPDSNGATVVVVQARTLPPESKVIRIADK